jgi:hypothetical protein
MKSRRFIGLAVAFVAAASLLLATAGPVAADPVNPPNRGLIVTLHCTQLGDLTVIQEGNGLWTRAAIPWHVLDSNQVLLIYAVHFVVTPTGEPTQVVDASKPGHESDRLDVCTQHDEGPDGVFDGTYWVSYTPN